MPSEKAIAAARNMAQRIVIEASKAAGYPDSLWIPVMFKHELIERLTNALAPEIPDEELDRIQAYCDAATEGWYVDDEQDRYGFRLYDKYHQGVCRMTSGGEFHDKPNARFIANARTDLPRLVQALRRKSS